MRCSHCTAELSEAARFCKYCGRPAVTAAPARPAPPQETPEPSALPADAGRGEPSLAAIPEGYVPDPDSGLYYRITPGRDPVTGAPGNWASYYHPARNEFKKAFYPD